MRRLLRRYVPIRVQVAWGALRGQPIAYRLWINNPDATVTMRGGYIVECIAQLDGTGRDIFRIEP